MAPINLPDGSEVSEVILPDGSTASEVIAPDGSTVFRGIPDSAIAHAVASDYDGSKWVADVGPDLPDDGGDPSQTSVTANSVTFDVVRYDESNGDYSSTTSLSTTGDPICAIYVVQMRSETEFAHYIDGGSSDEFSHLLGRQADGLPHRIISGSTDVKGDDADANFHVFCLEGDGSTLRLIRDDPTNGAILSGNNGFSDLTGLTLVARADGVDKSNTDFAEYTVLENHTTQERDDEMNRLGEKYNIF